MVPISLGHRPSCACRCLSLPHLLVLLLSLLAVRVILAPSPPVPPRLLVPSTTRTTTRRLSFLRSPERNPLDCLRHRQRLHQQALRPLRPSSPGRSIDPPPQQQIGARANSDVEGAGAGGGAESLKRSLLSLLEDTPSIQRGQSLTDAEQEQLEDIIGGLQEVNPNPDANASPLLPGNWQLICTFKPGANVSFTDLDSWRRYLTGKGPSPIQALVTGNTRQVNGVYQMLDLGEKNRFDNIVKFSDTAFLNITAKVEDKPDDTLIRFRFWEGNFIFKSSPIDGKPFAEPQTVPYPVPFKILSLFGDETLGSLRTIYLDEGVRVSQGNKGSFFVFKRVEKLPTADDEEEKEEIPSPSLVAAASSSPSSSSKKYPVIICPAQFGIAPDYDELIDRLQKRGHEGVYTADLARLEWLRIIPSAFTEEYWTGNLKPNKTLQFYYDAITRTYEQVRRAHPESKINFVGHSIGGWVLRSWLKEHLSPEEQKYVVASVTTLGTPHNPPPEDSVWKNFDQTRGLLKFINAEVPGAYLDGVPYACVVGNATRGNVQKISSIGALESAVAFVSYLPLCGDGNVDGDGIVPIRTGLLEDAKCKRIIINGAKHTGFLPSPGPSIKAPEDWFWYGAEDCIDEWAHVLI